MKRKTAIITICYCLALSGALGLYGFLQRTRGDSAEDAGRYRSDYAFEELCRAAEELDAALCKAGVASSPSLLSTLCADGYASAAAALTALGQLDYNTVELEHTAAFLNAAGESCHSLLRSAARGENPDEQERAALRELTAAAAWFHESLEQQRSALTEESGGTAEALTAMETDFPPLTDDGPADYPLLEGRESVSEHEAALVASAFAGQNARNAHCDGIIEGAEPFYKITMGPLRAFVTVRGGQLLRLYGDAPVGEAVYSEDEAMELSKKFLQKRGYARMKELRRSLRDNCLVTTWCYTEGDVVCFPDTVTLTLSLTDGSVVCFDAADYVRHHHSRVLDTKTYARDAARAALSGVEIQEEFLSLMTEDEDEVLCLTFRCLTPEGRKALVFCSAATGAQLRIMLVDENGEFV